MNHCYEQEKTLVVIASHNPVKIRAVEKAFALQFPDQDIEFLACSAASDVSDQPRSDEETRRGARNRAQNAAVTHRQADFWIGLEGGIENMDGQLMAFAWMAALGMSLSSLVVVINASKITTADYS